VVLFSFSVKLAKSLKSGINRTSSHTTVTAGHSHNTTSNNMASTEQSPNNYSNKNMAATEPSLTRTSSQMTASGAKGPQDFYTGESANVSRLLNSLLRGYDKRLRPNYNGKKLRHCSKIWQYQSQAWIKEEGDANDHLLSQCR